MHVSVRYMAQLRKAAGVDSDALELPEGSTPADLAAAVAGRHGEALRRLLLDGAGRLHPAILVFVGDVQADPDDPGPLRDGDVVTLLSPVAGGGR
jgi:molybdopterin converting factor small subunit